MTSPTPTTQRGTCARCGSALRTGAVFCHRCGTLIPEPSGEAKVRSRFGRAPLTSTLRIATLIAVLGFGSVLILYTIWVEASWRTIGEPLGGGVAKGAFETWLLSHGGLAGVGVTLTTICWIWLMTRLAVLIETRLFSPVGDDVDGGVAFWVATVYTSSLIVLIVLLTWGDTPRRFADDIGVETAGVVMTLANGAIVFVVVVVSTLQGVRRSRGARLFDLVPDAPGSLVRRSTIDGATRLGLLVLGAGTAVAAADAVIPPASPGRMITFSGEELVMSGVDRGFVFVVDAMSFFREGLYGAGAGGAESTWAWTAAVMVIVVFAAGALLAGHHAARDLIAGVDAGVVAGIGVIAGALIASGLASPNPDGLTKIALFASVAWAVVTVPLAVLGAQMAHGDIG